MAVWLRAMLLHMDYFGHVANRADPQSYRQPCGRAFTEFQTWKKHHKVVGGQRKFSYWSVFKEEYGTYMNTKGHMAKVISAWLEHVLEEALTNHPGAMPQDPRAYTTLVALILNNSVIFKHYLELFLSVLNQQKKLVPKNAGILDFNILSNFFNGPGRVSTASLPCQKEPRDSWHPA